MTIKSKNVMIQIHDLLEPRYPDILKPMGGTTRGPSYGNLTKTFPAAMITD
jgi:hypothetical protein